MLALIVSWAKLMLKLNEIFSYSLLNDFQFLHEDTVCSPLYVVVLTAVYVKKKNKLRYSLWSHFVFNSYCSRVYGVRFFWLIEGSLGKYWWLLVREITLTGSFSDQYRIYRHCCKEAGTCVQKCTCVFFPVKSMLYLIKTKDSLF